MFKDDYSTLPDESKTLARAVRPLKPSDVLTLPKTPPKAWLWNEKRSLSYHRSVSNQPNDFQSKFTSLLAQKGTATP